VFGHCDASSSQHGTAFNEFIARLLEVGKDQDVTVPVNPSGAKAGAVASQFVNVSSSSSGPAGAALAIAQIAARSKVLAACEEQKFNQFANEALLLQMKKLENRIETLQNTVESAVVMQRKVFIVEERFLIIFHTQIRNRRPLVLNNELDSMHLMNLATKCVKLQPISLL
jgi:hypothetical protein